MMLGAHQDIATGQESQLFHKYLRILYEQWQRELRYPETDELRKHGITSYIDEGKFIDLNRKFALSVFESVLAAKPGARIFLEKSPNNSFNIDLIHLCFPDAKFIHMIRDGRDVVTSMLAAKKGWGRQWAPDHAADAAAEWVEAVTQSRRLRALTEQYLEVRYEDLLESGEEQLSALFQFLGAAISDAQVSDIYRRFSFEKLKNNDYSRDTFLNPGVATASGTKALPEPKGFFRKGIAGDWKTALSDTQQAEVYWVAAELLQDLGYAGDVSRPNSMPVSIRVREGTRKVKQMVKSLGSRLLS